MAKKRQKITYDYECSITEEKYTVRKKAENPDDLISINSYYELHPEEDDRPEVIKMQLPKSEDE